MASFSFNSKDVSTENPFAPIPAGKYNVEIVDSDLVATKLGDGHYLKLTFSVMDGDYAGRYIWANLNVDNPNPKAVEIAERELARIIEAVDVTNSEGEPGFDDTQELHGIPLSGMVKIKPASGGYEASNTISNFGPVVDGTNSTAAPWA